MIKPSDGWTPFLSAEEQLNWLKFHRLTPKTYTEPKRLFYDGNYCDRAYECTVVGHIDNRAAIIHVNGQLHSIHPDYLLEMQAGKSKELKAKQIQEKTTEQTSIDAISSKRYFAFDVETPNGHNDRICELGVAVIDQKEIVWSMEYMINPEVYFNKHNTEIHGIAADDVEDAPTFPQVWEEILPRMEGCILVAHNAKFDLSVLSKTADAYNIDIPSMEYLCTMELTKYYLPELAHRGLKDVCTHYGISLDHHHADSDCIACAEIFLQLLADGCPADKEICRYTFDAKANPYQKKQTKQVNGQSRALNELLQLLNQVAEDGILTESEALVVSQWIEDHNELEGNYPYDRAFVALRAALEDEILDTHELEDLLVLFQQLSDPLAQACSCESEIDLDGKLVCLTGDFDHGNRLDITKKLEKLGAVIKSGVVKTLDYLVVGGQGSTNWIAGNYGTKVKKALELQSTGAKVQIIREADLFFVLEACYGSEACCV